MGSLKAVVGLLVGLLLLGLSSAWQAWATEDGKRQISGGGYIDLGHRQGSWSPAVHTRANLTEVKSIKSFFEFRTLDPEGAIFYGDTRWGQDWFVLSLRGGVPEMQIGKADILVTVAGGPKLNDGVWHKVELRSEGKFVVLEVDDKLELMVGLNSKQTEDNLTGPIRLGLGGMLIDEKVLIHPFKPEMDGCIRGGSWLNLSTPWDTDPNWQPRPCFHEIQRGSYFPGTGLAVFNTSELPGPQTEESGITIEVHGSSNQWSGTILNIQTSELKPILTVTANNETKDLKVTFSKGSIAETNTVGLLKIPKLAMTILKHSLIVDLDSYGKMELDDDTQDFLSMWNEGMLLAFGGVPVQGDSGSHYLHGCLERIQVQDHDVDLDRALYKHVSLSTHSCPVEASDDLNVTGDVTVAL